MSKKTYYHESIMFNSPDASDLPHPDLIFGSFYNNKNNKNNKDNNKKKISNAEYNKKATEEIKKLLGIN